MATTLPTSRDYTSRTPRTRRRREPSYEGSYTQPPLRQRPPIRRERIGSNHDDTTFVHRPPAPPTMFESYAEGHGFIPSGVEPPPAPGPSATQDRYTAAARDTYGPPAPSSIETPPSSIPLPNGSSWERIRGRLPSPVAVPYPKRPSRSSSFDIPMPPPRPEFWTRRGTPSESSRTHPYGRPFPSSPLPGMPLSHDATAHFVPIPNIVPPYSSYGPEYAFPTHPTTFSPYNSNRYHAGEPTTDPSYMYGGPTGPSPALWGPTRPSPAASDRIVIFPPTPIQPPGSDDKPDDPSPTASFSPKQFQPARRNDDQNYDNKWDELAAALLAYDQNMIKGRCENIDTLLVFAGLFSAVVTAFNVEAYQALLSPGDSPPPIPQNAAVRLNVIWFCSLIFSLIAASLGMLVRQWLLEYLKGHFTSSPEYVRVRYYRWDNLHRWHVFDLEAGMTILLQIALILFFVGISDLLRQLNPIVGWFITGIVALWLLLVAGSVLSPAIASRCPYKIFFFKTLTTWTRRVFSRCLGKRNWDESTVRPDRTFDVPSMIAADDVLRDDALLMYTLRPCLMTAQGQDIIAFIRAMLEHRLQKTRTENLYAFLYVRSLARLTNLALEAILHILLDALEAELGEKDKEWWPATYGWIEEGLVFLFGALNYVYYKDRRLGKAMDRGVLLQSQLVRLNDDFIRACLLLLVKYEHVPGEIRELTTGEFARVIRIAQQLIDSNRRLSPVQICRVMLSTVQLQHTETMQANRDKFIALLSSLGGLIAKAPREAECRHCVSSCLQACRDIQEKAREFIPQDLIGALNKLS